MRYQPGLCSVSFRDKSPEAVIALALANGLIGIEWGSDAHVPIGDLTRAAEVRGLTLDAGLDPASYGTYLRTGDNNEDKHLRDIAETAKALGASNIRIWAGPRSLASKDASPDQFQATIAEIRMITELASERGMTASIEFHADTMADDGCSTKALLDDVDHPALFTYWQPTPGIDLATSLAEIEMLAYRTSHVHVFNRDINRMRGMIEEKMEFWTSIFEHIRPSADWLSAPYAMIEFVVDDLPENLARDADFLKRLLER